MLQRSLASDIARHGGRAVLVCDGADEADGGDGVLTLRHPAVDEFCAPAVQIAAAQFFANGVALRRGFDPGTFRQSSKVTTIQ